MILKKLFMSKLKQGKYVTKLNIPQTLVIHILEAGLKNLLI